jgi:glycosyltransferase involved in cell wall biosynthesis
MTPKLTNLDLTVAICTLNRAELLRQTLATFEELTVPSGLRWEILIVDNGSTDATASVVQSFSGRLPVRLEHEPRRGQSVARNRVSASALGRIVLWTDDDVRADPRLITATLDAFTRFGADVVFGRSYPIWSSSQPPWYGPRFAGQFAILDYGDQPFVVSDRDQQFYGLNVAFTRQALDTLGLVREDMGYVGSSGGGGEDTEYFERALNAGHAPDSIVGHVIPAERATMARQRQFAWSGARSNYRLVREQFGTLPALLGVPRFMFRLAASDFAAYLKGKLRRDHSEAFYREIRLIRFAALVGEARRAASSSAGRGSEAATSRPA